MCFALPPTKLQILPSFLQFQAVNSTMESRTGRSASRYGSVPQSEPPHPPLMNGPVRKWRKQWVNCGDINTTTPLRLCKWTALSDEDAAAEETPKRRYRYYPVVFQTLAFESLIFFSFLFFRIPCMLLKIITFVLFSLVCSLWTKMINLW